LNTDTTTDKKTYNAPAAISILHKVLGRKPALRRYNCTAMIGMLNFLIRSKRLNLFRGAPMRKIHGSSMKLHEDAIARIVQYLMATKDCGYIVTPNNTSLKSYVDADFSGCHA